MTTIDDSTRQAIRRAVYIEATERQARIDAKVRMMLLAFLITVGVIAWGTTLDAPRADVMLQQPADLMLTSFEDDCHD